MVVFFHMRALSRPSVPLGERDVIARTGMAGCYRVTVRCGYMDDVLTPELGREVARQLVLYISRERGGEGGPKKAGEYRPAVQADLEALTKAYEDQTVYIIGKEVMKVKRVEYQGALAVRDSGDLAVDSGELKDQAGRFGYRCGQSGGGWVRQAHLGVGRIHWHDPHHHGRLPRCRWPR